MKRAAAALRRRATLAVSASILACSASGFAASQPTRPTGGSPGVGASQSAAGSAAYSSEPVVRFGNGPMFRNLLPSPLVEAQSAAEYTQLIERARSEGRLMPAEDARVERVRSIAMRIAPFAGKWSDRVKEWRWEVNVVRSREIGVFCLPGGKLVVYGGLLDRISLKDDELGVLFGHMIAHALREQVRERLSAQQTPFGTSPLPQLFGVTEFDGAPPAPASELGAPILSMRYDATDETEADVIGSDIAARAGFDPRAAVSLWDKLAAATRSERGTGLIRAHPYSESRRLDILKRLPDMLALYAKARGVAVESLPAYPGVKPSTARPTRNR
ncbi:M48 family metallopeptidase [Trinickia caryophylli]|uniref:Peptidase family M48 n=2 Tax=Trinickia caryophylli TaxID=28094 RepID=A0A1X7FAD2_TRICW|nr:M48 family metallopeptidase [Trinickia caryophylli]WQE10285.1 M48 family metallopeptidase [Trinickia caryophylli]GLU34268.1 hypothetical protein Busp01_41100 [Trinickia caryophylli]SMF48819.1 Peptidase family M48 [Trinickia caryophylli]